MTVRFVLLVTSPRVAPGLLSWPAWALLHAAAPVCTADPDHPLLPALADAGVPVEVLTGPADPVEPAGLAEAFHARGRPDRPAVWLAAPDGDGAFVTALGRLLQRDSDPGPPGELELLYGSYDLPGARLLDVVAIMDRLRSPGGCPWDAEQTHATLAPYLLEEAYEAYAAIEEDDRAGLREELGDLLLQVAFHARLGEDGPDDERWSIDEVAGELVAKLIRRHPHVFAGRSVADSAEVLANWEEIKVAEKGRASVVDGVPLGQPALSLAGKLQKRAAGIGVPPDLLVGEPESQTAVRAVVARAAATGTASDPVDAVGELLFAAVALARELGVDPEAALRARARRFRDRLIAVEGAVRAAGIRPDVLGADQWRDRWGAPMPTVEGIA